MRFKNRRIISEFRQFILFDQELNCNISFLESQYCIPRSHWNHSKMGMHHVEY